MESPYIPFSWDADVVRFAETLGTDALTGIRESVAADDGRLATIAARNEPGQRPWHSRRIVTVKARSVGIAISHMGSAIGSEIRDAAIQAMDMLLHATAQASYMLSTPDRDAAVTTATTIARSLAVRAHEAMRRDGVAVFRNAYSLVTPRTGGRAHLIALSAEPSLEAFDLLDPEDGDMIADLLPPTLRIAKISGNGIEIARPVIKVEIDGIDPIDAVKAMRLDTVPVDRLTRR